MPTEAWASVKERLDAAAFTDYAAVQADLETAEADAARLENELRHGGEVKPGEIEAAEARSRHARLRLEAVERKHAGLFEEARLAHRQQVHDELVAFASEGDSFDSTVRDIAAAVKKLTIAVPARNATLLELRTEASAVYDPDDGLELWVALTYVEVDGVRLQPDSIDELIDQALHDAVNGDAAQFGSALITAAVQGVTWARTRPERERAAEERNRARLAERERRFSQPRGVPVQ